jgi:hypothetical protein
LPERGLRVRGMGMRAAGFHTRMNEGRFAIRLKRGATNVGPASIALHSELEGHRLSFCSLVYERENQTYFQLGKGCRKSANHFKKKTTQ